MAQIKVKRKTGTPNLGVDKLIEGELGIIGSYLAYAPNSGGTASVDIKVVAAANQGNSFIEQNTFKMVSDNYFQILNSSSTKATYGKTDGYLYSIASDSDITNATDRILVTRAYVDARVQGLNIKASVVVATTTSLPASYAANKLTYNSVDMYPTLDGYAFTSNDLDKRFLIKNQSDTPANGIYTFSRLPGVSVAAQFTRATDADQWSELISAFVFVEKGTLLADTGWVCTIDSGGTIGTNNIVWNQFSGAGTYTAGTGLTLSGSTFSLAAIGTMTALANITGSAAAPTAVTILDSASASAIGTNQSLVTERDIYYGLPTINHSHAYNSSTTIYAPAAGGTASWILIGAGTEAAPTWINYGTLTISTGLTAAGNYTPGGSQTITLQDIAAGSTYAGAIRYLGTGSTASGKFDSSSTVPTSTAASLNFQGIFRASQLATNTTISFNNTGFIENTDSDTLKFKVDSQDSRFTFVVNSDAIVADIGDNAYSSTYAGHIVSREIVGTSFIFKQDGKTGNGFTTLYNANTSTTNYSITFPAANGTVALVGHAHSNLTFNNGGSGDASGTIYTGTAAKTISYNTLGAAPASHATTATTYGAADATNYGHIRFVAAASTLSGALAYDGTTSTTAGRFNSNTSTNPVGTTRLNYEGYFYATKFYGDGTGLTGLSTTGHTHAYSLVNLNGVPATNSTATFFAPSVSGTANQILLSAGAGATPFWSSTTIGTMAYVANTGTTSITTLGTIGTGVWQGTAIGAQYGGTGITSYAAGDILYASATNALSKLAANTTTIAKYLRSISSGTPTWGQIAYSELSGTPSIPTGFSIGASSDVLYATGGTNTTAYNATTARTANRFYRHADMPVTSSTASALKYDGVLYAYQFEGIIDGGVWA